MEPLDEVMYWLVGIVVVLFVLSATVVEARPVSCDADGITDKYDIHFRLAARRSLPRESLWCAFKSQCFNESHLNPNAESPVGAVGVCQLMTGAWSDVRGRGSRTDAKRNIEAGTRYMARMLAFWSSPRPSFECSWDVALASYNAGPGNILKAQTLSGGQLCWDGIRPHLESVTGMHSKETEDYVTRFWRTYARLLSGGRL